MSGEAATQLDFAQAMTDFKIMFPDMEVGDMLQGIMLTHLHTSAGRDRPFPGRGRPSIIS